MTTIRKIKYVNQTACNATTLLGIAESEGSGIKRLTDAKPRTMGDDI